MVLGTLVRLVPLQGVFRFRVHELITLTNKRIIVFLIANIVLFFYLIRVLLALK